MLRCPIVFQIGERFISASWTYNALVGKYIARIISSTALTFEEGAVSIAYERVKDKKKNAYN
jgi:hypothetical protein